MKDCHLLNRNLFILRFFYFSVRSDDWRERGRQDESIHLFFTLIWNLIFACLLIATFKMLHLRFLPSHNRSLIFLIRQTNTNETKLELIQKQQPFFFVWYMYLSYWFFCFSLCFVHINTTKTTNIFCYFLNYIYVKFRLGFPLRPLASSFRWRCRLLRRRAGRLTKNENRNTLPAVIYFYVRLSLWVINE